MSTDDSGFFSRWSRRKAQNTPPVVKPAAGSPGAAHVAALPSAGSLAHAAAPSPEPGGSEKAKKGSEPGHAEQLQAPGGNAIATDAVPGPTLEDVGKLTPESDFKPFVGRAVTPEVRNAAMKKLFADPHFNVMDGLDIYIDDYSKPSPLPAELLKKMVSAQFMQLVEAEPEPAQAPAPLTPGNPAVADATVNLPASPEPPDTTGMAHAEKAADAGNPATSAGATPALATPVYPDHPDGQRT